MPETSRPIRYPNVTVVIPARNEARNLEVILPKLPPVHQVILVDGHSVDETIATARRVMPDIHVVQQTRRGKGNALACGFAAATGDIIVMFDADGSALAEEIPAFVQVLMSGADVAKGSRFIKGGGSHDITRFRRAGNYFLNTVTNVLLGSRYTDLCYGYNAFWSSTSLAWTCPTRSLEAPVGREMIWGDGFEIETVLNCRFFSAGLKIVEVPSVERLADPRREQPERGPRRLPGAAHDPHRAPQHAPQAASFRRAVDATSAGSRPRRRRVSTVSVVICAYTEVRWQQLQLAVSSVEHQTDGIEVILVVDHNDVLLHRARRTWPKHTVIPNTSRKGLSGARNTGIDVARGELVAFLDDDAFAQPDWIELMTAPFADAAVEGSAVVRCRCGPRVDRPACSLPNCCGSWAAPIRGNRPRERTCET